MVDVMVDNSYAAVTCSIHNSGMPYMMHAQAQQKAGKGSAEVIHNFDVIMKTCLNAYKTYTRSAQYPNGLKPSKIIYYRDGVGEGQFPEILHTEMRSIRKACSSLSESYQPAITFITVQKRHKTRFFMQKEGKATEENAPPGTVVDTAIVHPTENDFFLLSHQGIRGTTVRPTRYHVLWDDSDFSADQIQQLTYYLCYMYVRCNRSVSIPAPTYYAHHAASRASVLAQGQSGSINDINQKLLRTELNAKSPMHFV
ncbi:hypothetical protein HA402_012571 [Bradysia odoriphaga]|nr:hypothetical protein HA402_012571 [Bradysia odoriphaga]